MQRFDDLKYDVFIAYHGDALTGSEGEAARLYDRIHGMTLVEGGRKLNVYFHPKTHPYDRFERTPEVVAVTPMFIFVVNGNVPRDYSGMLPEYKESGMRRNIYDEICSFYDSPMRKMYGGKSAAKLYITDNTDFEARKTKLHPLFLGVADIRVSNYGRSGAQDEVARWIRYFYANEYKTRMHEMYRSMLESSPKEFMEGHWVPEAESLWHLTFSEEIGRTLLIYYSSCEKTGGSVIRSKMREVAARLRSLRAPDEKTRDLLNIINRKFNI